MLARVTKEQIAGKSVAPALLKVISEETKGQSLTANIALIRNNVNSELALLWLWYRFLGSIICKKLSKNTMNLIFAQILSTYS